MKRFLLVSVSAVLTLVLYASPASAATANFQGDCLISHTCDFDAQRPFGSPSTCSPASISSYAWNFGDGTTGTGVAPTHFFSLSTQTYSVTLTITCSNSTTATLTRTLSWAFGGGTTIIPAVGYN
jgi:hypothetical protein